MGSAYELMPSKKLTPRRMIWSATRKKMQATKTITNTMMVVTVVSLRVGQVTFCASARTSCRNLNGSIFAIDIQIVVPQPVFQEKADTADPLGKCSSRKSDFGPQTMADRYCRPGQPSRDQESVIR